MSKYKYFQSIHSTRTHYVNTTWHEVIITRTRTYYGTCTGIVHWDTLVGYFNGTLPLATLS